MLMPMQDAFSPEVMEELARPVPAFDPRFAQVVAGVDPKWCLAEVYARSAEAEIAKRRFGLYVPEMRETIVRRGRKVDLRRPMFPGYVLVFMWPGGGNRDRLRACGVMSVVGALHDEEVDLIRAVENKQEFPRSRPKPRYHNRLRARRWEEWLQEIRSLDSDKRNQALRKLLSLF